MPQSAVVEAVGSAVEAVTVNATARHADLPATMRQDRALQNLDRHPSYIRAAYMASCT
jgi:hypothetical protein